MTEAAAQLGVARSTAHRLLSMLVYRDFAVQGANRRYASGLPSARPVVSSRSPGCGRSPDRTCEPSSTGSASRPT